MKLVKDTQKNVYALSVCVESYDTERESRKRDTFDSTEKVEGWGTRRKSSGLAMFWKWTTDMKTRGRGEPSQGLLVKGQCRITFNKKKNWSKSKGDRTYWKVKGFAKNMKESTIVMAFLPVVTAKELKHIYGFT